MLFKFFKKRSPRLVKRKDRVTINGRKAHKLYEFEPRCPLFGQEVEDWERVKKAVQGINIYATAATFECFLNQVILTGKTEDFIEYLNQVLTETTNDYIMQRRQIIPCE